jgi:putative tryptophan/tyrosine transport system substrate-binding protein
MRRREFIAGLAGVTAAWPLPVQAQKPDTVFAGFLSARAPQEAAAHTAAFFSALAESGYVRGRNLVVEYRWAEGRYDELPTLAKDLTRKGVAFIAAIGGSNSALAAKAASSTTPIVFIIGDDPVALARGKHEPTRHQRYWGELGHGCPRRQTA